VVSIDLAQLAVGELERIAAAGTERERTATAGHFQGVFEQALNTPLFSPWPPPLETPPAAARSAPQLSTQPLERNRPRNGRQRRG
jgi:hypothetical protein